ncbi:MAG: inositol monophosphatase family protein [Anaerolineae bacterium]|nr:inositol monophosphatase family protein [Anaerolineae bacterium]
MPDSLRDYLDFAMEIAWQAGQLTLGYFQTDLQPDFKADESPVTVADRQAEQLIRRRIEERFPAHAIIGEEFGGEEYLQESAGYSHRWIIDPIDGTRSFVRGVPLYAVLIGLEIEGQSQIGVAHFPALGEMIAAATGEGCWWNGRRACVSKVNHLKDALIVHYDVTAFEKSGRAEEWKRLKQTANYRAGWCDAYGYSLVATGRAEVMLDPIMNVWDCAALMPILQEAGGYFGDWQGNPTIYGNEALATTQKLLPEVLRAIHGD